MRHSFQRAARLWSVVSVALFVAVDRAAGQIVLETSKLVASDVGPSDRFGTGVAVSGGYIVVGSSQDGVATADPGAAYVFDLSTGEQIARLAATDGAAGDAFGTAVAIAGDRVYVGSPNHRVHGPSSPAEEGAVYVFDLATGEQIDKLVASGTPYGNRFGFSLSADDQVVVVGAPYSRVADAHRAGAVYVFDRVTGERVTFIPAPDGRPLSRFGTSVALSNGLLLIGEPDGYVAPFVNSGFAYVYDMATGQQVARFHADDLNTSDSFGSAVALWGETVVVGAFDANYSIGVTGSEHGNVSDGGAAYVFDLGTGELVKKLTSPDPVRNEYFGRSVAVNSTSILVGADGHDQNGLGVPGAAFVFDRVTGQRVSEMLASDRAEGDRLGTSAAVSGRTAVLGANLADTGGHSNGGAVYVYNLSGPALCSADLAEPFGGLDLADIVAFVVAFGARAAPADFDGDGVHDLADVGAFVMAFEGGCP